MICATVGSLVCTCSIALIMGLPPSAPQGPLPAPCGSERRGRGRRLEVGGGGRSRSAPAHVASRAVRPPPQGLLGQAGLGGAGGASRPPPPAGAAACPPPP